MYLKEREITNLVIVGDNIREVARAASITREEFLQLYEQIVHYTIDEVTDRFEVSADHIYMLIPH